MEKKNEFRPGKKGAKFAEGKGRMYEFEQKFVRVIQRDPPMAWERTPHRGWKPYWPREDIEKKIQLRRVWITRSRPLPPDYIPAPERRRREWMKFVDSWGPMKALILPFGWDWWAVYRTVMRRKFAVELVESTPALALALFSNRMFEKPFTRPLDAIEVRLTWKQKEIAAEVGFPSRNATITVLRKLDKNSWRIPTLELLRWLLQDKEAERMCWFLSKINRGALEILARSRLRNIVGVQALDQISKMREENQFGHVWSLVDTIRQTWERAGETPHRLESYEEIRYEYNRCVDAAAGIGQRWLTVEKDFDLPPSPFPGYQEDGFRLDPINKFSQLVAESWELKHCVATLVEQIRKGDLCIYRLTEPERATLSIRKNRKGVWVFDQFKGKCNREIETESVNCDVNWWCHQHGIKGFRFPDHFCTDDFEHAPVHDQQGLEDDNIPF